jgi:hypothetical protein
VHTLLCAEIDAGNHDIGQGMHRPGDVVRRAGDGEHGAVVVGVAVVVEQPCVGFDGGCRPRNEFGVLCVADVGDSLDRRRGHAGILSLFSMERARPG